MRGIWILLDLVAAFYWFAWAFGLLSYDQWIITVSFCLLGVSCLVNAGKLLTGEA